MTALPCRDPGEESVGLPVEAPGQCVGQHEEGGRCGEPAQPESDLCRYCEKDRTNLLRSELRAAGSM